MEKTEFQKLLEESGINKLFIYKKLSLSAMTYDKRLENPIDLTCGQITKLAKILRIDVDELFHMVVDQKNNLSPFSNE